MKWQGIRLPVVALTLAVVLAVLMGANWLWQRQAVNRPLLEELEGLPGIRDAAVERQYGKLLVTVDLADSASLGETYRAAETLIERLAGGDSYELVARSDEDEALATAYRQIHLILYETMSQGDFSRGAERIDAKARELGLDGGQLEIDDRNAYLTLRRGERAHYTVVPREGQGEG